MPGCSTGRGAFLAFCLFHWPADPDTRQQPALVYYWQRGIPVGGDVDAASAIFLQYSAHGQQCRYVGLLSASAVLLGAVYQQDRIE